MVPRNEKRTEEGRLAERKTVMKNTGTVLLCSLAIGVCIWIFDFVMVTAVQMILSLFA